jgi:hypothetical protein
MVRREIARIILGGKEISRNTVWRLVADPTHRDEAAMNGAPGTRRIIDTYIPQIDARLNR